MNVNVNKNNLNRYNYQKNNLKSAEPTFKGMHLSNYISDLQLLRKNGDFIKKLLPTHLYENRTSTINECIEHIKSQDFKLGVSKKNWAEVEEIEWSMEYLKEEGFLKERADLLLTKAYLGLKKLYKNHDEIIIPFSGGRDSTSLLATSLAFFPDKKYKLVTVLNGMSEKQENVFNQINYITKLFTTSKTKPSVETVFIDASENMKKHVIDTAKKDCEIIAAPAICSSCKIVMEKEIWNYLLNRKTPFLQKLIKKKPPILMGYTSNQRNQSWMEQSTMQIKTMENESKKYGIKVISPFFDVIEEPYDSTLLLGALGIPIKHQKSEMKCLAGGLNPQKLDIQTQRIFTNLKNHQTINIPKDKQLLVYYNPNEILKTKVDLSKEIQELKNDIKFSQGAYK